MTVQYMVNTKFGSGRTMLLSFPSAEPVTQCGKEK